MIPEGKGVAYECENGHVNDKHKSIPTDMEGFRPACVECRGKLERTVVPLRECEDCGNVWAYAGDSDRPTCPDCAGKRTKRVEG